MQKIGVQSKHFGLHVSKKICCEANWRNSTRGAGHRAASLMKGYSSVFCCGARTLALYDWIYSCKFANRFRKLMTLFANFAVGTTSFELRICKIVTFFWSFSRWTSSECVTFFAFFRRKCSIFPQNFLEGLRPLNPPISLKFFPMKVIGTHNIFSKEKYSIFGKIFSGGSTPRTPQMLLISISVFMQNFPNRGILSKTRKTRGPFSCPNRGMVQTEGCL